VVDGRADLDGGLDAGEDPAAVDKVVQVVGLDEVEAGELLGHFGIGAVADDPLAQGPSGPGVLQLGSAHDRVPACGEGDELNAVLGLLAAYCPDCPDAEFLRTIQNDLFDVGADLCVPPTGNENPEQCLRVTVTQYERLEKAIDRRNDELQPLRSFILPGGTPAAAWLHLARTVCRRAERSVVTLMATEAVNAGVLIYLNRLSDFLFVLSRAANGNGAGDVLWVPGKSRSGEPAA
jgi:cob(I)alamin adenosyltransferase